MAIISKSLHIVTSGFLVTVVIFLIIASIVMLAGFNKIDDVLDAGDSRRNNLDRVKTALDQARVAYILTFIAAGLSLLLSVMYAGQERLWHLHQGFHAFVYLLIYASIVIAAIYAFLSINELNHLDIEDKNSGDTYLWVGLLMILFAFIGLAGTSSAQLGMTSVRSEAVDRTKAVESKINEHLPVIRRQTEEIHRATTHKLPVQLPSVSRTTPPSSVATTTVRRTEVF